MNAHLARSFLVGSLALLGCLSCASSSKARIVETEDGMLQSIGTNKEEPEARLHALDGAEDYCKSQSQRPIFRQEELNGKKKDFTLDDLKNIPLIGKVLKGSDKTQVMLSFKCSGGTVAHRDESG